MATFRVYEISWDVDGASVALPSEVEITCANQESIADALSDAYGWLVFDFKAERLGDASEEIGARP